MISAILAISAVLCSYIIPLERTDHLFYAKVKVDGDIKRLLVSTGSDITWITSQRYESQSSLRDIFYGKTRIPVQYSNNTFEFDLPQNLVVTGYYVASIDSGSLNGILGLIIKMNGEGLSSAFSKTIDEKSFSLYMPSKGDGSLVISPTDFDKSYWSLLDGSTFDMYWLFKTTFQFGPINQLVTAAIDTGMTHMLVNDDLSIKIKSYIWKSLYYVKRSGISRLLTSRSNMIGLDETIPEKTYMKRYDRLPEMRFNCMKTHFLIKPTDYYSSKRTSIDAMAREHSYYFDEIPANMLRNIDVILGTIPLQGKHFLFDMKSNKVFVKILYSDDYPLNSLNN